MRAFTFGNLVGEMARLARADPLPLILSMALLVGSGIILDTQIPETALSGSLFLSSIIMLILQVWTIRRLLVAIGIAADQDMGWRVLALFFLSIPTTLGIILGLILLILPGLFLAARWAVAAPILIAENASIGAAIGESWDRTDEHWLPIAGMIVATSLPTVAGGWLILSNPEFTLSIGESAITNTLLYGSTVAGWVLGVAAYALLGRDRSALEEVFA